MSRDSRGMELPAFFTDFQRKTRLNNLPPWCILVRPQQDIRYHMVQDLPVLLVPSKRPSLAVPLKRADNLAQTDRSDIPDHTTPVFLLFL